MASSSSSSLSFTNKSFKIFWSRSAARNSVCWWCFWVSFSSHLIFAAASATVPTTRTTTSTGPTPAPLPFHLRTPAGGRGGGINTRRTIIIALSVSALLFLTSVLFMAFFKFLKFKIRRRSKRVEDVEESSLPKTHVPAHRPHIGDPDLIPSEKNTNRRFSWEEIERLAMNFSSVIGVGGFSTVYLAYFSDCTLGALKIHKNSERLNRLFKQELEILLHVRHENIVKFLGYCDERDEGVLVFEYIPNGSLHDKLHHGNGNGEGDLVLPWKNRMSIALQLALAIEYLHDKCTLQIVHGDIKASNVLLDENLNCKLCDFGFAKMGFSSMVMSSHSSINPRLLIGSPGYMDPHYLRSGIASKKNDVYSFGVMILELITGIEAFCSEKEQLLTSIAAPILSDANNVGQMVDPRLEGNFDAEEAITMASISALCLRQQPSLRPSMSDVLRTMREKKIWSVPDTVATVSVEGDHHHHHSV